MSKIDIENIKENTRVLGLVINETTSALAKMESVVMLMKNLEILEENLSKEDFAEFLDIQNDVNKIVSRLTEPSFLKQITENLKDALTLT